MRRFAHSRRAALLLPLLAAGALAGCAPPPPPPPSPPPPPPPPAFVFPYAEVWTDTGTVVLQPDSGTALALVRPFTRLRVLAADSTRLRVRCTACPDSAEGSVPLGRVVYRPLSPDSAARLSLAHFALAVRDAAERGDTAALRPVLHPGFSFAFIGQQGPDAALASWAAEGLRSLRRVPALLEQGLATRDSSLWVAPPAFAERLGYQDLRLGFRRNPAGEWRWVFLVRGEA